MRETLRKALYALDPSEFILFEGRALVKHVKKARPSRSTTHDERFCARNVAPYVRIKVARFDDIQQCTHLVTFEIIFVEF